jgi:YD repeat-containing protein
MRPQSLHVCGFLLVCLLLTEASFPRAQSPVQYVYDELGRLVAVVAPNGESAVYTYDAVGNLLSIARHAANAVTLVEFTPNGGPIGAAVTLYGTGFSPTPSQNTVTFNGTAATVTASTATSITTSVPSGATSGTIGVTTPLGSATSSTPFVVGSASGAPTISGFTPTIGMAGTAVTVTGTNFDTVVANNRLALNRTGAWPTTASATSLETTVPAATGSGRFGIRTPAGAAVSSGDFFVPPAPFVPADVIVTDRMAPGDTRNVTISTANKVALVIFDGAVNQRVSLKTVPGPNSGVAMYRPNLTALASLSTGIQVTLLEPPLLPHTGTYSILLDPVSSGTGTTTFTLYDVPPDLSGPIPTDGTQLVVTTSVPGQNARYTFTKNANDRISLWISSGPLGTVTIRRPDDTTQATTNINVVTGFIDTMALPATGTYSVFVDYFQAGTGSVGLKLYTVPADVTGTLSSGVQTTLDLTTPGRNALLSFAGTAGQRVSFYMNAPLSATHSILKPDGSTQASFPNGLLATWIEPQTLVATGTHTFKVDPNGAAAGSLPTTMWYVDPDVTGTIMPGTPFPVDITTPGQNGLMTFAGTAGQRVSLSVSTGGPSRTVTLRKPDGSTLAFVVSATQAVFLEPVSLPTTGTYSILDDPSLTNVGLRTHTLHNVVDVTGSVTINGTGLPVTLDTPGDRALLTFSGTASQQVTVRMTANSIPSTWVYLMKPDGTQLGQVFGTQSSFNMLQQTLPTSGTYTVIVDPSLENTGGITVAVTSP